MPTALSINPGRIPPGATTTISFIGTGTTWKSSPPTFGVAGAPSGDASWALGTMTVIDDTHATLVVTAGVTNGTVTWTDSTTSATTTMTVANPLHRLVRKRRGR